MKFGRFVLIVSALIVALIGAFIFLREPIRSLIRKPAPPASLKVETDALRENIVRVLKQIERLGLVKIRSATDPVAVEIVSPAYKEELAKLLDGSVSIRHADGEFTVERAGASIRVVCLPPAAEKKPLLAIVIDDIGNSLEAGEAVLAMQNVSIAIIPELKYSLHFAKKGQTLGKDVLVHIPMEPKSADKYTADAIMLKTGMNKQAIAATTERFLKGVPGAIGANNHMGSRFTEDEAGLAVFMDVLKKKNLFFLDSRTSAESKAYDIAGKTGIPRVNRNVFLDHDISEEKISTQLDLAVAEAQKRGFAVAIGHPHRETITVLQKRLPEIAQQITIIPVSKLVQ